MPDYIPSEDFMWGYQDHFRIKVQLAAKHLFGELDSKLLPEVRLIGLRTEEDPQLPIIAFEPQDNYFSSSDFDDILAQIEHHSGIDPNRRLHHSHPIVQEHATKRLSLEAIQNAIASAISRWRHSDAVRFTSSPVDIGSHQVLIVLSLNKAAFESHYSLIKDSYRNRFRIYRSLLDAVVNEFLSESTIALQKRNLDSSFHTGMPTTEEVLKHAANSFFNTINASCNQIDGIGWGVERMNSIALQRYERGESRGRILFATHGHKNIAVDAAFTKTIPLGETRAARKAIEMSSEDIAILSDGDQIYGLGHVTGHYDAHQETLFNVTFYGSGTWQLSHDDHQMMKVTYGIPSLPTESLVNFDLLTTTLKRLFDDGHSIDISSIQALAEECTKQKKGTMLVITSHASKEAARLTSQAIKIAPIRLNSMLLSHANKIDGAILIDPSGVCHSIGVILDGIATTLGSSARGARFNSAIRYIDTRKSQGEIVSALVFSEDGTVDILPTLPPRSSAKEISQHIETLETVAAAGSTDTGLYHRTLRWLSDHRLYITSSQAKQINAAKRNAIAQWPPIEESCIIREHFSEFDESHEPDHEWLED